MHDESKEMAKKMSEGLSGMASIGEAPTCVKPDAEFKVQMEPGCEDLFPEKAYEDDAAYDLKAANDAMLLPGRTVMVPAGFKIGLVRPFEAQVRPRSGLARKHSIQVLNSPGTVDAGYRGVVGVILHNAGVDTFKVARGDRIAQMVICRLPEVRLVAGAVDETARGGNGFGSTGKK